jgi:hypothetical protein
MVIAESIDYFAIASGLSFIPMGTATQGCMLETLQSNFVIFLLRLIIEES